MPKRYSGDSIFGTTEPEEDNINLDIEIDNADDTGSVDRSIPNRSTQSPISIINHETQESISSDDEQVAINSTRIQRGTKDAVTWRSHTKTETGLYASLKRLESIDLTRHLINAHGISAQQYKKLPERDLRYNLRQEWTQDWVSRRTWSIWPLKPQTVPRRSDRIWSSSIAREEKWTPSRDLEDEIFTLMLKKARSQWDDDVSVDAGQVQETKRGKEKLMRESESNGAEFMPPRESSVNPDPSNQEPVRPRKRKFEEMSSNELDKPVMSTDDDHSRRILQPMIKSTLSKFDEVILALQKSSLHVYNPRQSRRSNQTFQRGKHGENGSKAQVNYMNRDENALNERTQPSNIAFAESGTTSSENSPNYDGPIRFSKNPSSKTSQSRRNHASDTQRRREHRYWSVGLQDWSQVLGMATVAGVSPEVIARTTARCAALFNEEMEFQTLCEDDLESKHEARYKFGPKDILSHENPSNSLAPNELSENWDIQNGCPFQDCAMYGRTLKDWGSHEREIKNHLVQSHDWIDVKPPNDLMDFIGTTEGGAVHRDGYLTPLERQYSTMQGLLPKNTTLEADQTKAQPPRLIALPAKHPSKPIPPGVNDGSKPKLVPRQPIALNLGSVVSSSSATTASPTLYLDPRLPGVASLQGTLQSSPSTVSLISAQSKLPRGRGGRPRLNPRVRQPPASANAGSSRLLVPKPFTPISSNPTGRAGTSTDNPATLD
jgi:hypothetical protein